jgi:hypothetical protein
MARLGKKPAIISVPAQKAVFNVFMRISVARGISISGNDEEGKVHTGFRLSLGLVFKPACKVTISENEAAIAFS